jgi:hypothetical protein
VRKKNHILSPLVKNQLQPMNKVYPLIRLKKAIQQKKIIESGNFAMKILTMMVKSNVGLNFLRKKMNSRG